MSDPAVLAAIITTIGGIIIAWLQTRNRGRRR